MAAFIQIKKAVQIFKTHQNTLVPGLSPEKAAHELSLVSASADDFEAIGNQIAQESNASADAKVLLYIKKGKLEILMSALSRELQDKYAEQIWSYEDYNSLKSFLESIYSSTLTNKQKVSQARKKLEGATRFTSENEKFCLFLKRLTAMGKPILTHKSADCANMFIEDAFHRNISPKDSLFLKEHGYDVKEISEIAAFLDSRGRYEKTVTVSSIEGLDLLDLKNQIAQLTCKTEEKFEALVQLLSDSQTENAIVNKVKANPWAPAGSSMKANASFPTRGPGRLAAQPGQATSNPNPINRRRFTPSDHRPQRCMQCGIFGHSKEKCPRTCNAICHKCGIRGHLQAVCRNSKNFQ